LGFNCGMARQHQALGDGLHAEDPDLFGEGSGTRTPHLLIKSQLAGIFPHARKLTEFYLRLPAISFVLWRIIAI